MRALFCWRTHTDIVPEQRAIEFAFPTIETSRRSRMRFIYVGFHWASSLAFTRCYTDDFMVNAKSVYFVKYMTCYNIGKFTYFYNFIYINYNK